MTTRTFTETPICTNFPWKCDSKRQTRIISVGEKCYRDSMSEKDSSVAAPQDSRHLDTRRRLSE